MPSGYGTVAPSNTPGGNNESGNVGVYAETGNPDQSHANGTTVTLAAGEANWHVDFAFHHLVQLGNRLWIENDTDGDATTGTVTPVVGQIVTATSSGGVVYTATTDTNGLYTITVPASDVYTVTTSTPVGTLPSTVITTVANDGNATANNDKNHANTGTQVTVVTTNNLSVDFGFHPILGSIGDTVWGDLDHSGGDQTTQGSEPGLAGVVVTLTQTNGTQITTTTSMTGFYLFPNLPLGVYTVTVNTNTLPAGYQFTPTFDADSGNDSKSLVTLTPAVPDRRDQDFSYPPLLYDWGDLPDGNATNSPNYATLNANNGPSHVIVAGLHMGANEDNELDGQRNNMALGDDNNPGGQPDDEDGVTLPTQIIAGQTALITVTVVNTTGQNATLYGFIDWNGDGDFNDLNEQLTVPANNSGNVVLSVSVPATATTTSQLGARFRLSTDASRMPMAPPATAKWKTI